MEDNHEECPECLIPVHIDELDMFGGLCKECSGSFDALDTSD
jgi:hypothetical protein